MVHTHGRGSAEEELRNLIQGVAKHFLARTYGPDGMPWGTRFSELEELSVEIGKAVSQSMVEQALARQAGNVPPSAEACPGCGKAIPPNATARSEPRALSTTVGRVEWNEPERYCPGCRAAFFPSSPRFGH
jgi:hypothetical protein